MAKDSTRAAKRVFIQRSTKVVLKNDAIRGASDLAGRSNLGKIGAGDGAQTRDPQVGNLMLYQLSYSRICCDPSGTRTQDPSLKRAVLYQLS